MRRHTRPTGAVRIRQGISIKSVYKYKIRIFSSIVPAAPESGGSAEQSEAIGARVRTQVRICIPVSFARIFHSESISFYYITVIAVFITVQE